MAEKALALGIRARGQRWCGPPDLPAEDTAAWCYAQGVERRLNSARARSLNVAPQPPLFKARPPDNIRQELKELTHMVLNPASPPASSHGHEPQDPHSRSSADALPEAAPVPQPQFEARHYSLEGTYSGPRQSLHQRDQPWTSRSSGLGPCQQCERYRCLWVWGAIKGANWNPLWICVTYHRA